MTGKIKPLTPAKPGSHLTFSDGLNFGCGFWVAGALFSLFAVPAAGDGKIEGQEEFLKDYPGEAQLTSPFLCAGCSRAKHRAPARMVEQRILQAGLF